eukprot:jgi/Psemu1/303147/fgenesh1_kg.94_\
MKRYLTLRQQQQPKQQRTHHPPYLGGNIAILERCRPLLKDRGNGDDREAKRQKLGSLEVTEERQSRSQLQLQLQLHSQQTTSTSPVVHPESDLQKEEQQQQQHRMMALLSSAASLFSNRDLNPSLFQHKPREQQDQEEKEARDHQDKSVAREDNDASAAVSASTPATSVVVAKRRTSRSVSFCDSDDDVYKSYQMALPDDVSKSLDNHDPDCTVCHDPNTAATAPATATATEGGNSNVNIPYRFDCPLHHLPPPPRLPTPGEVIATIAPLANATATNNGMDTDTGFCGLYMMTTIYSNGGASTKTSATGYESTMRI